ncbi:MAG: hypothetical protein KDB18_13265, partial [Salinibacterium sp.]|nr:hypothetical protein [Salinibacterium sp.]
THREGNAIYLRAFPELVGSSVAALTPFFEHALVLGVVTREGREFVASLDPSSGVVLSEGDLLVLIARSYDECQPKDDSGPVARAPVRLQSLLPMRSRPRERLLILGWSYKIQPLLVELSQSSVTQFEGTSVSRIPAEERDFSIDGAELPSERIHIRHVKGDYVYERVLASLEPARFDHIVILSSSIMSSSEEADARTVLGYAVLRSLLEAVPAPPEVMVELLDPDNAHLFDHPDDLVLVSPRILSHLLAHVALRPALNAVFETLIGTSGADIDLRRAEDLGLSAQQLDFSEVQAASARAGCVALGFLTHTEDHRPVVHFNPDRLQRWDLGAEDRIIFLGRQRAEWIEPEYGVD